MAAVLFLKYPKCGLTTYFLQGYLLNYFFYFQILDNNHILKVIKSIKGPFSIVYYSKVLNEFYFTRDQTGRTSLLFNFDGSSVIISSVLGKSYQWLSITS